MSNYILIGMPGAGKSTIGVLAAKARGMDFIDTDLLIQQKHSMLLQKILDKHGVSGFVKIESEIVKSIECQNSIIATGGSVVLDEEAMIHLKRLGKVIFLDVPLFVLLRRLRNISTRGVVMEKGQRVTDIYNHRHPLYQKYADVTIRFNAVSRSSVEKTVKQLLEYM